MVPIPPPRDVRRVLVELAERCQGDPEQPLALEELARALGTTPGQLLPLLHYLERRGWVALRTQEALTYVWVQCAGLDEADRLGRPWPLRWWYDPPTRTAVVSAVIAGVVAALAAGLVNWFLK